MKKFLLLLAISGLLVFTVGCEKKEDNSGDDKKIQTVTNIELDKEQYIEQLKAIKIPYTITVDGKEYKGIYELNDFESSKLDTNPKYDFKIVNLTTEGDISIKITKK